MDARKTANCNDELAPPHGMSDEDCYSLPIERKEQVLPTGVKVPTVTSFWSPSPEELEALKNGGLVVLTIVGVTHPPVMVGVGEVEADAGS